MVKIGNDKQAVAEVGRVVVELIKTAWECGTSDEVTKEALATVKGMIGPIAITGCTFHESDRVGVSGEDLET